MYACTGNVLSGSAHGFGFIRALSRVSMCAMPENS